MAQLEASNEYKDIICTGPIYPMTARGGHLDANGYRWFGEILGKVYYQTQIKGKNFKPLQPKEILLDRATGQIQIRFHVPVHEIGSESVPLHGLAEFLLSLIHI